MTIPPLTSTRTNIRSRSERKDLTRNNLLQAALNLIGQGRSFTSLALREIAREAGVVPNAFYRHFSSTDELGLALVEEVGTTLRRLLREARQGNINLRGLTRRSIMAYQTYVKQNRNHFLFVSSERSGGSKLLRMAIRTEVTHFTNEMAQDFRAMGAYKDLSTGSMQMICGLVVIRMLVAATDILDLPPDQPLLEQEMTENFVKQIQMVLMGAACWKEKPRDPAAAIVKN